MIKHPAKYNDKFIPIFAELLSSSKNILDPFAGTGKIGLIKNHGFVGRIFCNEIEKEWGNSSIHPVDEWHFCDSANMDWAIDEYFDAICTSPTYGNRMADHFNSKDSSKRITYKHYLGKDLNKNNTGRMQWGAKYKEKHLEIYKECKRVLKLNGIFILNVSDHIRKGKVVKVSKWHEEILLNIGMTKIKEILIKTERMKFGKNYSERVKNEVIYVFKKGA
jgi:hypothetical protein